MGSCPRAPRIAGSADAETARPARCGEVVTPIQAEIELEFNRHGPEPGLDRYHLHARCFTTWEAERRQIPGSET